MARQLQKRPGQGFTSGSTQGRVAASELVLLNDGVEKAFGHIPFGGGPDAGVLIGLIEKHLGIEFAQSSVQAVQNTLGLLEDLGELPIGEAGQIRHINLAVIAEGKEGGPLPHLTVLTT
jgi:hypothetical protein